MTPGPNHILQCPDCSSLLLQRPRMRARYLPLPRWSDGELVTGHLEYSPALLACGACGHIAWSEDFETVDEYPSYYVPDSLLDPDAPPCERDVEVARKKALYDGLPWVDAPEPDAMVAYIRRIACTPAMRRVLRVTAWQAGNDTRRFLDEPTPLSHSEIENLEALVDSLDAHRGDPFRYVLLRAEALRELGRLDEARAVLEAAPPRILESDTTQCILAEIRQGRTAVCKLNDMLDRLARARREKRQTG